MVEMFPPQSGLPVKLCERGEVGKEGGPCTFILMTQTVQHGENSLSKESKYMHRVGTVSPRSAIL